MRIRLNEETIRLLQEAAEPGERPQTTLDRLLRVRDQSAAYPVEEAFMTFRQIAVRWECSVPLVKMRVRQYRESGGKIGLGPVARIGYRKVLVPMAAVLGYEKGGVFGPRPRRCFCVVGVYSLSVHSVPVVVR